jgi:two-component system response regulator MprA
MSKTRVLIVDDDARTTRLLAHMLREDGFEVELAWDGAAAIRRLTRAPPPNVLVTDLEMPHVDGLALTRFARTKMPGLPILIVTGYPELAVRVDGTLEPRPVVITKPLDYARFTEELRRASDA